MKRTEKRAATRAASSVLAAALAAAMILATVSCSLRSIDDDGTTGYDVVAAHAKSESQSAPDSSVTRDVSETVGAPDAGSATETAPLTEAPTEPTAPETTAETTEEVVESAPPASPEIPGTGFGLGSGFSLSDDARWNNAVDGMILETVTGGTYKAYILLIRDPSRVSVAVSDRSFATGARIFDVVARYGALAAINGGEFPDNGVTTLSNPIGLTYSGGECVWNDGLERTFIGFTKENKLFVEEGTLKERADELGIRDAVAFQTGNTLITNDGSNITYYYAEDNTGVAQRTAIGQLADGTVMFLVTDGRTAQSLGATKNDIIDTFIEYGAVTAGMLDGGSSAMLWYRDWYTKYGVDENALDDWQRKGLVNIYKAFTNPRAIPSYFIVK